MVDAEGAAMQLRPVLECDVAGYRSALQFKHFGGAVSLRAYM
jgi:hypothetical protein